MLPYLVVDYADLGSVDASLKQRSGSSEEKLQIAIDIACGLELLHGCDIVHDDVKLENILVFSEGQNQFKAK